MSAVESAAAAAALAVDAAATAIEAAEVVIEANAATAQAASAASLSFERYRLSDQTTNVNISPLMTALPVVRDRSSEIPPELKQIFLYERAPRSFSSPQITSSPKRTSL